MSVVRSPTPSKRCPICNATIWEETVYETDAISTYHGKTEYCPEHGKFRTWRSTWYESHIETEEWVDRRYLEYNQQEERR